MTNSSLTIIDVNLNRVLESLRLLEDISRFSFRDKNLTRELKNWRQKIFYALRPFHLIEHRDTVKDTAKFLNPEKEFYRKDFSDIITANCRRLQEGLRVLEEFLKLRRAPFARTAKTLRFRAYGLEKEFLLRRIKKIDLSLYAILDAAFLPAGRMIRTADALLAGGITALQLRAKALPDREFLNLGMKIRKLAAAQGVPFIVNDRPDLALAVDADGVHVGQKDLSPSFLRRVFGYTRIIGYSAACERDILTGIREGADYIGLSPVFPTSSKPDAAVPLGPEKAAALYRRYGKKIPVVVLGGINRERILMLKKAGVRHFAMISALLKAPSPGRAAREFKSLIKGDRS